MRDKSMESDVYNYAIRLLAKRDYSAYILRQKLELKTENSSLIDAIVQKVQMLGYQSDDRYVKNFIAYGVAQKKGPIWIQSKLREKGLDKSLVEKNLQEAGVDWQRLADEQLFRKYNTCCEDHKEKSRRFRFLIARGFESRIVMRSLEEQEKKYTST